MRGLGSAACLSYPHKNKTRLADKLHRWICQSQAGWFLDVFLRAETCGSRDATAIFKKNVRASGAMLQDPEQPHRVCCLDHDEFVQALRKGGVLSRSQQTISQCSPHLTIFGRLIWKDGLRLCNWWMMMTSCQPPEVATQV